MRNRWLCRLARLREGSCGCLRRGGPGRKRSHFGCGTFAHATFNEEADDHGDADNDRGDDGLFKSFPAAMLDIQLKTGRDLKRVLRTHVLITETISIANANIRKAVA